MLCFIDSPMDKKILWSLPYNVEWRDLMLQNIVPYSIFTYGNGYDSVMDPYIFALFYKHGCYNKCDKCCHPVIKMQLYTTEMFEDIFKTICFMGTSGCWNKSCTHSRSCITLRLRTCYDKSLH